MHEHKINGSSSYEYIPQGLMAEEWGKTGYRTKVTEFLEQEHLRERSALANDASRDALEYIWSLDDTTVLAARRFGGSSHLEVCKRLGDPNPWWVIACCASVSYDRGLIDEDGLNRIMNEI